MIRYYVLCKKYNEEIETKLSLGCGKNALCQRRVDRWVASFRRRRTSVEDDDTPGRPSRDNFSAAISGYSEGNSHASCCEIAKDLFFRKTTISGVLQEIGSRFFMAR
jgi:hypothetical protein